MKKFLLVVVIVSSFFFAQTKPASAAYDCEWSVTDQGKLAFCAGGFSSKISLSNHKFKFNCTENCDSTFIANAFSRMVTFFTARNSIPVTMDNIIQGDNGYYSCVKMDGFDQSVYKVVDNCMRPNLAQRLQKADCLPGVLEVAAQFVPYVGGIVKIKMTANCIAHFGEGVIGDAYNKAFDECLPGIDGIIEGPSGLNKCTASMPWELEIEGLSGNLAADFNLCNQINGAVNPEAAADCVACVKDDTNPEGLWTAIGCIPTKPESIIRTFIKVGVSVGGGITLLLILAGSFQLSVSQGDAKKTDEAKEQITSAIIGLIFILLSVTILQFIGVSLFQIPGFGT